MGTWSGDPPERIRPLVIEWEPGSDIVGDFTWPGFDDDIIVTEKVAKMLTRADVRGFSLGFVEMVQNSEPSKRRSKKKCIRLPYQGEKLWDLWIDALCNADKRSTMRVLREHADGRIDYEVDGVERREAVLNKECMKLVKIQRPRVVGQGIFVNRKDLHGATIFRVSQFPAWLFCSDEVKQIVEHNNFSNVSFMEMGDIC
ncbi:hypothetical protein ACLK25_19175 [Leptospira kirschneri]|uniref:hypothetical protein n=1 Tax=Leptospira kirschneri TaxID=29507 RepID=UPI0015C33E5D|nr:hypothetical protein [Leptospira kirschneri]